MAMSLGGGIRQRAEMNVTPLVDILLVLLIIFMVIQPSHSLGLKTEIPQSQTQASSTPRPDIVITVQGDQTVRINQELLPLADLASRLKVIFAGASSQAVFVRADKDLEFREVAEVIDIARGAGLNQIGLMTR